MKFKKLKSIDRKVPKQAEAKRDGVINLHNYNFNQFQNRENFDVLKALRINRPREDAGGRGFKTRIRPP